MPRVQNSPSPFRTSYYLALPRGSTTVYPPKVFFTSYNPILMAFLTLYCSVILILLCACVTAGKKKTFFLPFFFFFCQWSLHLIGSPNNIRKKGRTLTSFNKKREGPNKYRNFFLCQGISYWGHWKQPFTKFPLPF